MNDGQKILALVLAAIIIIASVVVVSTLTQEPTFEAEIQNTGCPETDHTFGTQYFSGLCTITTTTTWGNGTLTLNGDLQINADFKLWNMNIKMDSNSHEEDVILRNFAGDINWFNSNITSNTTFQTRANLITGGTTIIRNGTHSLVTWDLSNGDDIIWLENNTFGPTNARDSLDGQHMYIGPNATIKWNTYTGIEVHDGAIIASFKNWGNSTVFGNSIGFKCMTPTFLTNCMGVEVISSHDALTDVAPWPAFTIAWNNFTFESIAATTDSNAVDIEFSHRIYVHNNTGTVDEDNNADEVTEFLLHGGARDSIFENNTGNGLSEAGVAWTYCFFSFIYTDANNLFQYNTCDDMQRMFINGHTGTNEYRHNTMTNVTESNFWYCDWCLGSPNSADDNIIYNNSFTYNGATVIYSADPSIDDHNTFVTHGAPGVTQRCSDAEAPPCHDINNLGWFVYQGKNSIEKLTFENKSNGDFWVTMEADGTGRPLHDIYYDWGATDNDRLIIAGNIHQNGSTNPNDNGDGTNLWSLGSGYTSIIVNAVGSLQVDVKDFVASQQYDVGIWNVSASAWENTSFTTDSFGDGGFTKIQASGQYNYTIEPSDIQTFDCSTNNNIGVQDFTGNCVVTTSVQWGNGTLTFNGDITVSGSGELTIWNLHLIFNQTADKQHQLSANGDRLWIVSGSNITAVVSSSPQDRWELLTTVGAGPITLSGSIFQHGMYDISNANNSHVTNNMFRDTDVAFDLEQHFWLGPNSTFVNNEIRNVSLADGAGVVVSQNYGNSTIFGNDIYVDCFGNNCMAIEVINMQESQTPLFPGFPVVEVGWNNVTWTDIGTGDFAITTDNEFSHRLWIHNNSQTNNDTGGEEIGNCLQNGGVRQGSFYENNTCNGPQTYGVWQFIYDNSGTIYQYNTFNNSVYAGIIKAGNNTYRHNVHTNTTFGQWICNDFDGGCAGGTANPADNVFYNNTYTYLKDPTINCNNEACIARLESEGAFASTLQNIFIGFGSPQITQYRDWDGGDVFHTVWGDGSWLYWANQSIEGLVFTNSSGGRYVNMTVDGFNYHSFNATFGTTNGASLSIEGTIDQEGSLNLQDVKDGTFLWELGRQNTTADVHGSGLMYFNVTGFFVSLDYDVSIWNYSDSTYENTTFSTDINGDGQFTKVFTPSGLYNISIEEAPSDAISDLTIINSGTGFVLLRWTMPAGAVLYDARFNTVLITAGNFDASLILAVPPPIPGFQFLNVTGLGSTTYWFAIKWYDGVIWSGISNVVSVTLP